MSKQNNTPNKNINRNVRHKKRSIANDTLTDDKKRPPKIQLSIWILSLLSSVLLSIPFLAQGCGFVSLFAFIPLLAAEYLASEYKIKRFWITYYVAFLLWNCATTYWIYLATLPGAIAAVVLNALQMAVIFALFRWMRRLTKGFLPYLFLIIAWIAWEHSYFNWHISWPWLVMGNSFSSSVKLIQWYEFTGALGGSLWILLCNTLLFRIIVMRLRHEKIKVSIISYSAILLLPVIFSLLIYYTYDAKQIDKTGDSRKDVYFSVLQPNIDPYNDKFGGMTQKQQTDLLLDLANTALNEYIKENNVSIPYKAEQSDDNQSLPTENSEKQLPVYLFLAPETFLSLSYEPNSVVNETYPYLTPSFVTISDYMKELNKSVIAKFNIILGAETDYIYSGPFKVDKKGETIPPTETARQINRDFWHDRYNASIFIGSLGEYAFYHKSKLVIMVESTPFTGIAKPLKKLAINLGGSFGSFGIQKERSVFTVNDSIKIGTAICYESVYGDYYREYILKGANLMTIITNDGWWGNTPGYIQHLHYASLRAIETRRAIARSANTGISAFINEKGDITANTNWWKKEYLNGYLTTNDKITFFVKHGDIIGRLSRFLFMLFALMGIVKQISKKYIIRGGE